VHRLVTSACFLGLLLAQVHAEEVVAPDSIGPAKDELDRANSIPLPTPPDMCKALEAAAHANDLPIEFFVRVIWQESRFNPHAVSRAGAQGIAQFMPTTAAARGLQNPFDSVQAITKSAELLRDLRGQFGNLGLAAAAYNAGPKRVQDWLAGRRTLPYETQAYIRIVTGRPADEWQRGQRAGLLAPLPERIPCPGFAKLVVPSRPPALAPVERPQQPWGVQLAGSASETSVLAAYQQLQKSHAIILAAHEPLIIRTPLGKRGFWYRLRVGLSSREDAEKLCAGLRGAGVNCLVQRN
jgi:Transglycosylase SLT domain/SPOR domain